MSESYKTDIPDAVMQKLVMLIDDEALTPLLEGDKRNGEAVLLGRRRIMEYLQASAQGSSIAESAKHLTYLVNQVYRKALKRDNPPSDVYAQRVARYMNGAKINVVAQEMMNNMQASNRGPKMYH